MLTQIEINQYRKLKNLIIDFNQNINAISGTNGTCKTSILHIVGNSYQKISSKNGNLIDNKSLTIINQINQITNPKIENLTRGDKKHNDPSNGHHGTLYTITYSDQSKTEFRKHNSETNGKHRYAIKPYYKRGAKESLKSCPVIYLGLTRLFPFGEYNKDDEIIDLKKSLPEEYNQEITQLYKKLTGISIAMYSTQQMGDVKVRHDFESDQQGIDSNTISAGEDNLFIILTAIISLKYYYKNLRSSINKIESILLIDELDATLHPSLQYQLLDILNDNSKAYKIQVIFTTHSLSLLEYAFEKKNHVVYLYDNINHVKNIENPNIYKIRMYLEKLTKNNIYVKKIIPILIEDEEAKIFLELLFDYFSNKNKEFASIVRHFHIVNAKLGSNNLEHLFSDPYVMRSINPSICILDGDKCGSINLNNYIIALPGQLAPDELAMTYAKILFDTDDESFWSDPHIINENMGKTYFRDTVLEQINNISSTIQQNTDEGESNKGVRRRLNKEVFKEFEHFFKLILTHWINNENNQVQRRLFYDNLKKMFKKTSISHGIDPNLWDS